MCNYYSIFVKYKDDIIKAIKEKQISSLLSILNRKKVEK